MANIRDAYAVLVADSLSPDTAIATDNDTEKIKYTAANGTTPAYAIVTAVQTKANWQSANDADKTEIAGTKAPALTAGSSWKITINAQTGKCTIVANS